MRRWTARLSLPLVCAGILGVAVQGEFREAFARRPIARPRPADPQRRAPELVTPEAPADAAPPSRPQPEPELPASIEGPTLAVRTPNLDCTPIAADGYRRGRKTAITLVSIDGEPIERATADAYWAMREAAAADGHELMIFSAFRTQEQQQYFYDCYRSCACNNCSPAAKPGHSNHQMGRAVDIAMWPEVHAWLEANAGRFGFAATVAGEPWHWELRRGAKPPATPACPRE